MSQGKRLPLETARRLAERLAEKLAPLCWRLEIAGSIRREKPTAGDIELLYIPRRATRLTDLFRTELETFDEPDTLLESWLAAGEIEKRTGPGGHKAWGREIKLAWAIRWQINIDFFTTTERNWWNTLICRTGSADHNILIASIAREKGWKWNPAGAGFTRQDNYGRTEQHAVTSEEDLFQFLRMPYKPPRAR